MNQTVQEMLAGNTDHAAEFDSQFEGLLAAQHPDAVTVCCSDSRVLQDHMWGIDRPGEVFTAGNIGNRVVETTEEGEVVSGDVLYPVAHTRTETAVIVGHTGCGAVTATYDALTGEVSESPGIARCIDLLKPHVEPGVAALPGGLDRETAINHLVEFNVDEQVDFLVESDEVPDSVRIVGTVYDFQDAYEGRRGEIHVINVDGERDVETLHERHPEVASRIDRLWKY